MRRRDRKKEEFLRHLRRGRTFETKEKSEWLDVKEGVASFEVPTRYRGRSGRIDIKIDELGNFISVIEIKATDWDKILPHRVQPTALRHARQLWRYVNKEVEEGISVCPGLIYQIEPSDPMVKAQVEEILNDRMIQVVWREEQDSKRDR